ncbi:MAG: hypothetical protein JXC85_03500 [Candidatus Aenigmarchaeota archaeon]|nr:hypothetical protein [Candidatus Aenigmarchaeota archaeon]
MVKKDGKYPEGHFLGMWTAIGIAVFAATGIPLSIATGNPGFIGVGPALGVAIGLSIGQAMEDKHKKEGRIRPITKEEKKRKERPVLAGVAALCLGAVASLILSLSAAI